MKMVNFKVFGLLTAGTYYFDQFNVNVDMPKYTDEEYEKFLQGSTYR
jgi:hypothetical protein